MKGLNMETYSQYIEFTPPDDITSWLRDDEQAEVEKSELDLIINELLRGE
jgi:hypothetical protein